MKLPEITIELNDTSYEHSFEEDISIDRTNLENEFATHAEKYSYYATLAEIAKDKVNRKKWELEQTYARLDAEKRALALSAKGVIKYTEKMYENEVLTDPRYSTIKDDLLKAQLLSNQLSAWSDAMSQKRDMLIQMGAHQRSSFQPLRTNDNGHDIAKQTILNNKNKEI